MPKYDFMLDIDTDTSTGIMIRKIPARSSVLEFGCASGRMTRYMKEILGCRVTIVEIDQKAYEKAAAYAVDGVCDDIMTFSWLEKFKDTRFDRILFADVLEHLPDPVAALSKAASLLKKNGRILISIPNITHNDILLKACADHFTYTKTGLLDETHLHFWGAKDIQPFAELCGLRLLALEGTYCDTGMTEQFGGELPETDPFLLNALNERQYGNVYQFVITLGKSGSNKSSALRTPVFREPTIRSTIYLDIGNGFNQNDIVICNCRNIQRCEYVAQVVIENAGKLRRLRFDPVENQGCVLTRVSAYQDSRQLPAGFSDSVKLKDGVFLPGPDPMVFIDVEDPEAAVVLDISFLLIGGKMLSQMCETITYLTEKRESEQIAQNEKGAETRAMYEAEISRLRAAEAAVAEQLGERDDSIRALQEAQEAISAELKEARASYEAEIDRLHAAEKTAAEQLGEKEAAIRALQEAQEAISAELKEARASYEAEIGRLHAAEETAAEQLREKEAAIHTLQKSNDAVTLELEKIRQEYQAECRHLQEEVETKNKLIQERNAYVLLVNKKDILLAQQERQIEEQKEQLLRSGEARGALSSIFTSTEQELAECRERNEALEQLLVLYQHRKVVRAADFVRRILRSIKGWIKRLFVAEKQ